MQPSQYLRNRRDLPALLECVPNFSEGRDHATINAIVEAMRGAGADVLDWSADVDHNRTVVTVVGEPDVVERAAFAGARMAIERIDLRHHEGVHPRVGAVDVIPFVPLRGVSMDSAVESARRVGARIATELGVPAYFYGAASEPPGRTLAELRRGGFEALADGWPEGRRPDVVPADREGGAHPSAGAVCVGARPLLLAWNVEVEGLGIEEAGDVARALREKNSGLVGVRALALELSSRGMVQISMNLEDPGRTSPMQVFRRLEEQVTTRGGRVRRTEIIGMLPDELVWSAAADRLRLAPGTAGRLLSRRLLDVVAGEVSSSQDA